MLYLFKNEIKKTLPADPFLQRMTVNTFFALQDLFDRK